MKQNGVSRASKAPSCVPSLTEGQIQRQILEWLAARHILAFRQNSGAVISEYKGRKRMIRYGEPGMADILTFDRLLFWDAEKPLWVEIPVWIEVKDAKGKQTDLQKAFEQRVQQHGQRYILARSLDDVMAVLK